MPSKPLNPSAFGISPKHGFLSPDPPPTAFRDSYYEPWDRINDDLVLLIKSSQLPTAVARLPLLETTRLHGDLEYRRAYITLGYLIHAHIWSSEPLNPRVPPQLSEPFLAVCEHLGMKPVLSYAGGSLWNWKLQIQDGGFDLANMEPLASFTGTSDEAAFALVPVLVEYEGGALMHLLLRAVEAAANGDSGMVRDALRTTTQSMVRMGKQLLKLYTTLDANFFYHVLRPFLAGGKGMQDKGLPDGVVFERVDGPELCCKFAGPSAVQSSLFPFLDRVLGIVHGDMTVYQESLLYMPGAHREFLHHVSQLPSLRSYVEATESDEGLRKAFNECMMEVKAWRGKHIAVVSRYVVQPAREAQRRKKAMIAGSDVVNGDDDESGLQGTGGSALMPFLRQARDASMGVETR